MTKNLARIALTIGLAVPLAACSSLFGTRMAARQAAVPVEAPAEKPAEVATAAPAAPEAAATVEGREHLAQARYGLAIDAFRKAMVNGEPRAPVLNGLGVAYARIGRDDLAQRYFLEAIAADPADQRFAANLQHLMRNSTMASRHDGDVVAAILRGASLAGEAPAAPAAAAVAVAVGQAPAKPTAPQGRLARVSSHEMHIATVAPMAAPRPQGGAKHIPGFRSLVRLELPRTVAGENRTAIPGFRPLLRMQMPAAAAATAAR